jgi:hypothetical protein
LLTARRKSNRDRVAAQAGLSMRAAIPAKTALASA